MDYHHNAALQSRETPQHPAGCAAIIIRGHVTTTLHITFHLGPALGETGGACNVLDLFSCKKRKIK